MMIFNALITNQKWLSTSRPIGNEDTLFENPLKPTPKIQRMAPSVQPEMIIPDDTEAEMAKVVEYSGLVSKKSLETEDELETRKKWHQHRFMENAKMISNVRSKSGFHEQTVSSRMNGRSIADRLCEQSVKPGKSRKIACVQGEYQNQLIIQWSKMF